MINTVRIIGGTLRGRKIHFNNETGLRPTHDRIRETLFNWLQFDVRDSQCLDLFAGSGALGFEAASRGAQLVTFVDNQFKTVKKLKHQASDLGLNCCEFFTREIPAVKNDFLSKCYDIVFLDPPFGRNLLEPSCVWLEKNNLLISGSYIYFECEKAIFDSIAFPESWQLYKKKSTQTLVFGLFQKN